VIELVLLVGLSLLGLVCVAYLVRWTLTRPVNEPEASVLMDVVRRVSEATFRRQSSVVAALSGAAGGAIFLAYGFLRNDAPGLGFSPLERGVWVTIAFALGASCALGVGQFSVWITSRANARVTTAARRSLDHALKTAMRSGAAVGLLVVAVAVLGVAVLSGAVFAVKGGFGPEPARALQLVPAVPMLLAGHALGASLVALFVALGSGTFAKSSDIAADIAAREAGISEADSENPATIADLAGDITGQGGARAIGAFQTIVAENLAAMLAGAMLYRGNAELSGVFAIIFFPLLVRAFGLIGAMFGVMVVRTDDREAPASALFRGLYVSTLLQGLGLAGAAKWLLGKYWLAFFGCGVVGIVSGLGLAAVAQYFVEQRNRPLRDLAEAARGGATLSILAGAATALEGAVAPIALIVSASATAFYVGRATHLVDGGLYGLAMALMGLVGTAGYVVAMLPFSAVVDSATGVVEISVAKDRPDVRGRMLVLDAVGCTGRAMVHAHVTAGSVPTLLLLAAAYLGEVRLVARAPVHLDIEAPEAFFAAIAGVLLVVWFTSRSIAAVAGAARRLSDEARRKLRERAQSAPSPSSAPARSARQRLGYGLDHEGIVEMAQRASLRDMLTPTIVVAIAPTTVGLALRLSRNEDAEAVAACTVAAFVLAGTIASVLGALLLGNAGVSWDNAKQYIVTGAHGGRFTVDEAGNRSENPVHAAASISDGVGDPLKDATVPALQVVAKLLCITILVFLPFFL